MEHHITIQSGEQELAATLHYPVSGNRNGNSINEKYPIIIIAHGFVGSRIGVDRLFVLAAREYARNGYMVLRFDYGAAVKAQAIMEVAGSMR